MPATDIPFDARQTGLAVDDILAPLTANDPTRLGRAPSAGAR